MKSSTERPVRARRPENQKSARSSKSNKSKNYIKQTAHVEARRDGKPLIFGWGGHLSRSEKNRIQRRATWAATALIALIVVGVIVGTWINLNIIIPGLPISTVNGHVIPQSEYRKMVVFQTELENNKINGRQGLVAQRKNLEQQDLAQQTIITNTTKQISDLNKQIKALPAGPSAKRTDLNNQLQAAQAKLKAAQAEHNTLTQQINNLSQNTIPIEQQAFQQSQIGNDSASWLQEDEIIREWIAAQSTTIQAKINPTPSEISSAMRSFQNDFPTTNNYNQVLKQDGVSNDDMQAMMVIKLRRDNMQNYLASITVSPTYQVHARSMTFSTQSAAQKALNQLHQGADFAKLAKTSVDTTTNTKGGDMGWLARGQYAQAQQAAIVENWLFDSARKINEISPILFENGGYHIVQVLNIDPSRTVDPATLKTLKDNALADWILMERALPNMKITAPDQTRLFDASNLPPDLPSAPPAQSVPGAPGSSSPGGLPPTGP